MLELTDKKFKVTIASILRALMEKNRQHTRTDW